MVRDTKIITAVTTEPLTLAEVKSHLHLDSTTMAGGTSTDQSITPGSHVVADIIGSAVDVLGVKTLVNLNTGTCAGTVTAKIQDSDDNITWTDYSGGVFTAVTGSNDDAVQTIEYTGGKQYIRVAATVADAACEFSADIITKTGETAEDDDLNSWITEAREFCEGFLGRALATQTIEAYLDAFPGESYIEIPYPPLQSVTSMKYTDCHGTQYTMVENTQYEVDLDSTVGRIILPFMKIWPMAIMSIRNPIVIRYVAGYSASNLIPSAIKKSMLTLIGFWHENRGSVDSNDLRIAVENYAKSQMGKYRTKFD